MNHFPGPAQDKTNRFSGKFPIRNAIFQVPNPAVSYLWEFGLVCFHCALLYVPEPYLIVFELDFLSMRYECKCVALY